MNKKTKNEENMKIGLRLREIRQNLSISQENFAETIELGVDHYRKLETGMYSLTLERILFLNRLYQVDPTYLLLGKKPEESILSMITNCSKYENRSQLCQILEYEIQLIKNGGLA